MASINTLQQSNVIQPLLTDLYQLTMAYGYWKSNKANDFAVFELFFRKNPFQCEFTIFAGLHECLTFLEKFKYSSEDIDYLKRTFPTIENEFFEYLSTVTAKDVRLLAIDEGTVVFPRIPLLIVEGPLLICQLLETTLLNLVNFASLMVTNAARYRIIAGTSQLLEFGLRRAQGPDGALSASKYSYMGGFDGTSNVLAGKLYNIPVKGTHGHSYITAFIDLSSLSFTKLKSKLNNQEQDLLHLAETSRLVLAAAFGTSGSVANDGELAAFVSFALAFPDNFVALVDTYDVLKSGLINFCSVALALNYLGYQAVGIRIDSGDLAYLSIASREYFTKISVQYNLDWFKNILILASNDINEETLISLKEQDHDIDCFCIGTHLVTCQKQPALGCVYKLVEVNNTPRIKLTAEVNKVSIPGQKTVYRLYGEDGYALIDILQSRKEPSPIVGEKVLCRHPFLECKRAFVRPDMVEKLHKIYWEDGKICQKLPNMEAIRKVITKGLKTLRPDIKRTLNPTPYKVSVSDDLYTFLHEIWLQNAPIGELF